MTYRLPTSRKSNFATEPPIRPWAIMVALYRGRHTIALLLEVGNVERPAPTARVATPYRQPRVRRIAGVPLPLIRV